MAAPKSRSATKARIWRKPKRPAVLIFIVLLNRIDSPTKLAVSRKKLRPSSASARRAILHQNSEQFITTRPRQVSLRQITLHFSWTRAAPQTGQINSLFATRETVGATTSEDDRNRFSESPVRSS